MTLDNIITILIGFGWGSIAEFAFYKATIGNNNKPTNREINMWRKGSSIGLMSGLAAGFGMYIKSKDVLLSMGIPAGYVIGQLAARSAIGYARRFVPESA